MSANLTRLGRFLKLLSDPTRLRLIRLLDAEELTVAELTRITHLPQSRVSTHLGKLREAGLLRARQDGAAAWYSRNGAPEPELARLCRWVEESARDPVFAEDRRRRQEIVQLRGSWVEQAAGSMERHYSPGRTWESAARGLLGVARLGQVLDVASGDGALAELVAPRAAGVTCLDRSAAVAAAGQLRAQRCPKLRFVRGDLHRLPFAGASFDQVLCLNALDYAERPGQAVAEAARVLKPGGCIAVTALKRHDHGEVVRRYEHRQTGFTLARLRGLLQRHGLEVQHAAAGAPERRSPHFVVLTLYGQRRSLP